jgi:hypothetical protein
MIYAKLFTNLSHFGVCRRAMQKCGDQTLHYLRVSVHQGCRTVSFSGALREVAMTVAAGQSATVWTPPFIGKAIVHTADHETLHGGIAKCSRRLQGRAHNSEAIL